MSTPTDRLEGWKEIAAYLNRSVRTVRRWEAIEGLPVRRHMHRQLGTVYASKSEIDRWREDAERRRNPAVSRAGTPASAAPKPSLAVLPFANLSGDSDTECFALGVTDEIIAALSKIRALHVISRTSSIQFKDTRMDVGSIGRALHVRYLVEGTVRRAGAQLRVSARLIDAETDDHLWTAGYDGTLADVFAIQERVARMVVGALEVRLTPDESRRLAERPLGDVHAYQCYVQARQAVLRWRKDAIDEAVRLLQHGLSLVGENAELYAALGRAHLQYREAGVDFSDRPIAEAERCMQHVLALDPRSAPGAQLRGWIDYARGRIQEAVRSLKTALASEPNDPDSLALLSNCYLISGRVAAARPLADRLLAVDPLTPLTRCMPGFADLLEGRFAAAIPPYREMFEMDPGNPMGRLFYAWVLALNARSSEVSALADTIPIDVQATVPAQITRLLARAHSGSSAPALEDLTPEVEAAAAGSDVFPRFLAHGYAVGGDPERAIRWTAIAVERGFINYPFLSRHEPALAGLTSQPEYQALLDRVRERWERFEE